MQVQRCPECGMRLKTNYCDVCMRRVAFNGASAKRTKEPWDSSSTHREEEDHECVSFDYPEEKPKKLRQPIKTSFKPKPKQFTAKTKAKKGVTVAVILAVLSVLPSVFGMVESVLEVEPEPEYNYDAYVAEDVPQITPTELYNDGTIVITADSAGLYYDDYTISMTIQNGSEQDITVNTDQLSVNGYMLTSGLYEEVDAGETQEVFLTLYSYELEDVGITEVANVAFYLNLYDAQEYTDIGTTELITLETDIADDYVQPVEVSGWELYNDGSVKILLTGMEVSSYGDCDLDVYIENGSDLTASVSTSAIQINGQEASGLLWNTLRSGTRAVSSVYIYDLEELEITSVEQIKEIGLDLHVEYMDDWTVEETVNEAITFTPEILRPYIN